MEQLFAKRSLSEMSKLSKLSKEERLKMKIKIVNRSRHPLPEYATLFAAGMDLRANLEQPITLKPLERSPRADRPLYSVT